MDLGTDFDQCPCQRTGSLVSTNAASLSNEMKLRGFGPMKLYKIWQNHGQIYSSSICPNRIWLCSHHTQPEKNLDLACEKGNVPLSRPGALNTKYWLKWKSSDFHAQGKPIHMKCGLRRAGQRCGGIKNLTRMVRRAEGCPWFPLKVRNSSLTCEN